MKKIFLPFILALAILGCAGAYKDNTRMGHMRTYYNTIDSIFKANAYERVLLNDETKKIFEEAKNDSLLTTADKSELKYYISDLLERKANR